MSKQRRKRMKRNKQIRSRRSHIRNGVEQLDKRVLPGGFLDLLAGAAIASQFDLLPNEQLVPAEIESESNAVVSRDRPAHALLQSDLSALDGDLEKSEVRAELTDSNDDLGLTRESNATTNTLVAASFVDSFFAGNQFVDTIPSLPISQSRPLSNPSRSFSSPISQLGTGVGAGSGQGYNVTGAELPQANLGSSVASASSIPAWMIGEGEDNGGASASGSASSSGSGTTTTTATATCGGSASGSGSMALSASGYVAVYSGGVFEGSTEPITFYAYFSGYAACGFAVDFSTSDGSATAGEDYGETHGSIWFAGNTGGTETVEIEVGVINDDIAESDEDFTLTLDLVHDGAGGPVAGIGIGSGAGSGSGSASGPSGTATGTIRNDDYDVTWSVSGTAEEGGAPAKLSVTVTPYPNVWVGLRANIMGSPSDLAATSSDMASAPIDFTLAVPFSNGVSLTKEIDIYAEDDSHIESTESFLVDVISTGNGSHPYADAVNVIASTANAFDVVDNEWRWTSVGGGTTYDTLGEDVEDERGALTLWKDHVDGVFVASRTGLNSIHAQIWAQYLDANGILIPDPPTILGPLDRQIDLAYDCQSHNGQILRSPGPVRSGTGTQDGLLTAGISWDEEFDYTDPNIHYVNAQIDAAIGYGGSVTEGVVLGTGEVGVEFNNTHDWGQAHEYDTLIRLACKKGSA